MEDKMCPYCGSAENGFCTRPPGVHYLCGTWGYDGVELERTISCREIETKRLQARVKELEAWGKETCEYISTLRGWYQDLVRARDVIEKARKLGLMEG
jgi:hypothetical protein